MAKITPIDVIKGISGKYGGHANDYFATNSSSNKIHLAKYANPYTGEPTDKQLAQRTKFASAQASVTAWLNANKPSEANGTKGTEAYQYVQKLKKSYAFSNINQVLYKYMDEDYVITLPEAAGDTTSDSSDENTDSGTQDSGSSTQDSGSSTQDSGTSSQDSGTQSGGSSTQDTSTAETKRITVTADPVEGGTVTGGGTYSVDSQVVISATPAEGYTFDGWNNGSSEATQTITVTKDANYIANFVAAEG